MSKSRGQSRGRQSRRGRLDVMGMPLRKRPFNNKKRTKGRALQADVQERYHAIMDRVKYLKQLARKVKASEDEVTDENWKEVFRKHDEYKLIYGPYEKDIMMNIVNS